MCDVKPFSGLIAPNPATTLKALSIVAIIPLTTRSRLKACRPPRPSSRVELRLVKLTTALQPPTLPFMQPKRQVIGLFLWLAGCSSAFKARTKLQSSSHIQRLPSVCTHHHGPQHILGHLHQQNFRDKYQIEEKPGDAPFLDLSGPPSSSVPDTFLLWLDLLIPGSCFALTLVALCLVDTAVMDCWPAPANAAAVGVAITDMSSVKDLDVSDILQKAGRKAIGGGLSGAAASLVQLVTLMWLRTTMQFQYRYGFSFKESLVKLYKEGGLPRFYRGLPVATLQLPLSRFGDVAANAFMLLALDSFDSTRGLPLPVKSIFGSLAAGAFRFMLMPLDAVKTSLQVCNAAIPFHIIILVAPLFCSVPLHLAILPTIGSSFSHNIFNQVQGSKGWSQVKARLQEEGVSSLYQGAVAQAVATFVGHWPFFVTFNYMSSVILLPPADAVFLRLGRNAILGKDDKFRSGLLHLLLAANQKQEHSSYYVLFSFMDLQACAPPRCRTCVPIAFGSSKPPNKHPNRKLPTGRPCARCWTKMVSRGCLAEACRRGVDAGKDKWADGHVCAGLCNHNNFHLRKYIHFNTCTGWRPMRCRG